MCKTIQFFIISLISTVISSSNYTNIDFIANPNCTEGCLAPWIIYGSRQNKKESVHYLYGAVDNPTFMMLSGTPNSSLNVNWTALQRKEANSMTFSDIHNLFGFSVQNIIIFNDVNDTGKIDNIPASEKFIVPTTDFDWRFSIPDSSGSTEYPVYFSSNVFRGKQLPNNAGISINLTAYVVDGRGQSLPHLLVSPNSALCEVSLDNLLMSLNKTSLERFTHARLAIDMMIFGSKDASSFSVVSFKSLDDEHTPGIFSIDEVVSQFGIKNISGYMQWRPVAYLTRDRIINFATRPNINRTLTAVDHSHMNASRHSLVHFLFGNSTMNFLATQTTIAFGRPKDNYYKAYNYTVWSFSFGLGDPPSEGFSPAVVAIISISIGLPVLVLANVMLYWCITKRKV